MLFIQCGTSHICPVCCNFHTLLSVRADFSVWIWQKYTLPLVVVYFPSEGVLKIRSKEDFALSSRILNVIFLYCRFCFGGGILWCPGCFLDKHRFEQVSFHNLTLQVWRVEKNILKLCKRDLVKNVLTHLICVFIIGKEHFPRENALFWRTKIKRNFAKFTFQSVRKSTVSSTHLCKGD